MLHSAHAPSGSPPGSTPDGTTQVLARLTGLRAFGALAVFVVHLDAYGVASLPWGLSLVGGTGVAFFFVLSGFVLAWGTRPGLPARTFYRRRFARVYPSDLVVLLVAALVPVVAVHRGWDAALANLFLVQAWFSDDLVAYGMNGVSWSLSCEAFFYALFPLAAAVVRRIPRSAGWSLALLGLLLAVLAYHLSPGRADHLPPVRAAEFLLGVVAGLAFRDGWRPPLPGRVVAGVLLVGVAVSAWLATPVINLVMALPFLALVVHHAERDVAGRGGWLGNRALVFAGEVSFAFYLVHELVIVNLLPVVPGPPALQLLATTTVSVTAAVGLHLLVEKPCNRLLRDRPSAVTPTATGPGRRPTSAYVPRAVTTTPSRVASRWWWSGTSTQPGSSSKGSLATTTPSSPTR